MSQITLSTPIQDLFMVGPIMAKKMHKLGIFTLFDLLYHAPSRYEDYRQISKIKDIKEGDIDTVSGKIDSIKNIFTKGIADCFEHAE